MCQRFDQAHPIQSYYTSLALGCQLTVDDNQIAEQRCLEHRRIFLPKDVTEHRVNRQWLFVPDWLKKAE